MNPSISELFDAQEFQQRNLFPGQSPRDFFPKRMAQFAMSLIAEMSSYVEMAGFVAFESETSAREERIRELVDAQKYLTAIMLAEGMTADEFWNLFQQKTAVVQHRARGAKAPSRDKVLFLDMDGVLCQDGDWLPTWDVWARNGNCANLPACPGAVEATKRANAAGWEIIIITARDIQTVARLEWDTYNWLTNRGVEFSKVIFAHDKGRAAEEFLVASGVGMQLSKRSAAVDDHLKHAFDYSTLNMKSFYVTDRNHVAPQGAAYTVVRSLAAAVDTLLQED